VNLDQIKVIALVIALLSIAYAFIEIGRFFVKIGDAIKKHLRSNDADWWKTDGPDKPDK